MEEADVVGSEDARNEGGDVGFADEFLLACSDSNVSK